MPSGMPVWGGSPNACCEKGCPTAQGLVWPTSRGGCIMRLATYALPPTARAERLHSVVSPGLFQAQFGQTILLYGDETRWEEDTERARRSALDFREHPTSLNKEHLHLVVQNGR